MSAYQNKPGRYKMIYKRSYNISGSGRNDENYHNSCYLLRSYPQCTLIYSPGITSLKIETASTKIDAMLVYRDLATAPNMFP